MGRSDGFWDGEPQVPQQRRPLDLTAASLPRNHIKQGCVCSPGTPHPWLMVPVLPTRFSLGKLCRASLGSASVPCGPMSSSTAPSLPPSPPWRYLKEFPQYTLPNKSGSVSIQHKGYFVMDLNQVFENILKSTLGTRQYLLWTRGTHIINSWWVHLGFCTKLKQKAMLDHREGWELKNGCLQTKVLEKTLESPLDYREIIPVSPKGN